MGVDLSFAKAWPYGVFKTIQWISIFAILLTIYLGISKIHYNTLGFVVFISWLFLFHFLISWMCHVIGIQKHIFKIGQGFIFIPFALIDFIVSILAAIGFSFGTVICFIATVYSLRFSWIYIFTCLLSSILSAIISASSGYFAILVYRVCPNGNLLNLMHLVIEGSETSVIQLNPNSQQNINV